MRILSIIGAICVVALAFAFAARADDATDSDNHSAVDVKMATDLSFEDGDLMAHTAYQNVTKLDTDADKDGAYGPVNKRWNRTHDGKWYIELQRNGGDLIDGGVATQDSDAIKRGLTILQWGFDRENDDGGFSCPDTFHSASFFVESAAHALLLLEAAGLDGPYKQQIDEMKKKLRKTGHWFMDPDVKSKGIEGDAPFTHRCYLLAAALGETGVLCHDRDLIRESEAYARDGISRQDASGFNPENGGYDSSYHAVGVWYAERYYTIAAPADLKSDLHDMLQKAVAWEATRIEPDGKVNTEGNSRVDGSDPESDRTGKAKAPAVGQVIRCFGYWALISGDYSYSDLAKKVAGAYRMED
ncbi:MAG: hypothetical protein ACLQVD_06575 [Capsulimonadaceae bacterium]